MIQKSWVYQTRLPNRFKNRVPNTSSLKDIMKRQSYYWSRAKTIRKRWVLLSKISCLIMLKGFLMKLSWTRIPVILIAIIWAKWLNSSFRTSNMTRLFSCWLLLNNMKKDWKYVYNMMSWSLKNFLPKYLTKRTRTTKNNCRW